jgi:hypothetical protein
LRAAVRADTCVGGSGEGCFLSTATGWGGGGGGGGAMGTGTPAYSPTIASSLSSLSAKKWLAPFITR